MLDESDEQTLILVVIHQVGRAKRFQANPARATCICHLRAAGSAKRFGAPPPFFALVARPVC
jgi:hypothetical protein